MLYTWRIGARQVGSVTPNNMVRIASITYDVYLRGPILQSPSRA